MADRLLTRKVMILANLLERAAALRYRRLVDLATGEWSALTELGVRSPRTLKQLADAIGLDHTQVSKTVKSLVARGLAERTVNPADHREAQILITHEGCKRVAKIFEVGLNVNERLFADRSTSAVVGLSNDLDQLTNRAHAMLLAEKRQAARVRSRSLRSRHRQGCAV